MSRQSCTGVDQTQKYENILCLELAMHLDCTGRVQCPQQRAQAAAGTGETP